MPALFRKITGNNNGDFYCLNCFQSYTTENKLKKHNVILSKVCNLLLLLLLSAILLISSVYTSCLSLLNLCCDFNMISCLISNLYNH